mgnify:CR=1 FL=1
MAEKAPDTLHRDLFTTRSDISHHAGRSHLYFPGRFPWRSQPNRIIDSHLDLLFDRRLSLQDQVGRYRGANRP